MKEYTEENHSMSCGHDYPLPSWPPTPFIADIPVPDPDLLPEEGYNEEDGDEENADKEIKSDFLSMFS